MKKSMISRIVPGFVQRAILKEWLPFGGGMQDGMIGAGSPTFMKTSKEHLVHDGYAMNPLVHMIVSYITRLAAQIPWVLYEVKDEKALNVYKNMDPGDTIQARIMERKALEHISAHKILEIWKRPNELQGQSEFIEQMLGFKLITGDTYVYGRGPETGPNSGLFLEMDILPAHLIGIKYGSPMEPVANYYWLGDPNKRIPPEMVMHAKYWNPQPLSHGGLYGLSPLQAASRVVTRNNDSLTASVKTLQNMGAMGMLTRDPSDAEGRGLTVAQAEEVEKRYHQKYGGSKNRGKIMVTGAVLKWQQMAMSPVDLQILEQEKMDLRQLCGIYHLQSQLFNDPENKTYSNMKEATTAAYTQAVVPEMRSIRDELNRWWIQPWAERDNKKYWFDMDLQAIPELQTNIKELIEWLEKADMLTLDERRQVINYEPLETTGTDQIWIDGGKMTLEQAMMDVSNVDKYLNKL